MLVWLTSIDMKDEKDFHISDRGKSKRLWGELYKVIDSSDVIIQVLDARDPLGTRSKHLENFMKKEKKHKHLILLLNKCDLVPTWATVSLSLEEFLIAPRLVGLKSYLKNILLLLFTLVLRTLLERDP
jgi:ribosome biogenesis GTPase A